MSIKAMGTQLKVIPAKLEVKGKEEKLRDLGNVVKELVDGQIIANWDDRVCEEKPVTTKQLEWRCVRGRRDGVCV